MNPRIHYCLRFCAFVICYFYFGLSFGQVSYNITFQHDGKAVHGTFSAPSDNEKYPTVIICPGTGQNDRNLTLPLTDSAYLCFYPELFGQTLKPYKELSDSLVSAGFAVLRYDKLEYTYSGTSIGSITFHKLWLPVESAIKYVKTRTDVDTSNIVLLGHSEGSALIPFIAKGRTDIKALISVAGSRSTFDTLFADQVIRLARMCNQDTIAAKESARQILLYYYIVRNHLWNAGTPALFGVPPAVWYDYLLATDPVVNNYNTDGLPTLFLGMEKDINVPMAELHKFENEITITDDFWVIPNAIHYLTPYDVPHISGALTDTIIYWLKKNVLSTSIEIEEYKNESAYFYPNPFSTELNVILPGVENFLTGISVINSTGEQFNLSNTLWNNGGNVISINLSGFQPGVYFIQLKSKNKTTVLKAVKI